MRVQRQASIAVPIPPALPPSVVLATLQTVRPVIRNLGTLARYEETSAGAGPVANDPFFFGSPGPAADMAPTVTSYQIFELITLAPGLTKEVTYPAYFQRVPDGLRCRANGAAGITGWCEFTVRPRKYPESPEGSASTPSSYTEHGSTAGGGAVSDEYELYESLLVEANSLLMPFVFQTMEIAHRGLCDKVLQEAAENFAESQGWDYRQLGRN